LACPATYRRINTFYKYYSGEMVAPVMTIFVGGNHEASNHLTELCVASCVCVCVCRLCLARRVLCVACVMSVVWRVCQVDELGVVTS
jgi:L-lactate utilization protein LutB